jgi:hypothetical protein
MVAHGNEGGEFSHGSLIIPNRLNYTVCGQLKHFISADRVNEIYMIEFMQIKININLLHPGAVSNFKCAMLFASQAYRRLLE